MTTKRNVEVALKARNDKYKKLKRDIYFALMDQLLELPKERQKELIDLETLRWRYKDDGSYRRITKIEVLANKMRLEDGELIKRSRFREMVKENFFAYLVERKPTTARLLLGEQPDRSKISPYLKPDRVKKNNLDQFFR